MGSRALCVYLYGRRKRAIAQLGFRHVHSAITSRKEAAEPAGKPLETTPRKEEYHLKDAGAHTILARTGYGEEQEYRQIGPGGDTQLEHRETPCGLGRCQGGSEWKNAA